MTLEYQKINRIKEADFDKIINNAGGVRINPHNINSNSKNADYKLNESILELKLICEDGLRKIKRQGKIGDLFSKNQKDKPVVILDTNLLSKEQEIQYYNLLKRPIQTAVKKAAKQLKETSREYQNNVTKVVIILNDGYSSLSMDEFERLVSISVRNDTSNIDYAIAGGLYYFSDRIDSYFISRFELIPVNINYHFPSFELLYNAWNDWIEEYMTLLIKGEQILDETKLPVIDYCFQINNIEYVKPCPPIGKKSEFWPEGVRPRSNSTGIEKCPAVAICYPKLTFNNWKKFKNKYTYLSELKNSFSSWCSDTKLKESNNGELLQPFVTVDIDFDEFVSWNKDFEKINFLLLCKFATDQFQQRVTRICDEAIDITKSNIIFPRYIFLETKEIGQDISHDMSSIYLINELHLFQEDLKIFQDKKIFFEYALVLASAYAIKYEVDRVIYGRDQKYRWM